MDDALVRARLAGFEAGYQTATKYIALAGGESKQDLCAQLQSLLKRYRDAYEDRLTETKRTWCFTAPPPDLDE